MKMVRNVLVFFVAIATRLVHSVLGQTPEPTSAPTARPTFVPTTAKPTVSPTLAVDLCTEEDDAIWDENAENFDFDLNVCRLLFCSFGIVSEDEPLEDCVRECIADETSARIPNLKTPVISGPCGYCWGLYASCMVEECACLAVRATSQECVECSAEICEADFTNCTGGHEIPPYDDSGSVLTRDQIIAIAVGSGAGLTAFMICFFAGSYRGAFRKRGEPDDELQRYKKMLADARAKYDPAESGISMATMSNAGSSRTFTHREMDDEEVDEPMTGRAKRAGRAAAKFLSTKLSKLKPPAVASRAQPDYNAGLNTTHADPVGHKFRVMLPFVGQNEDELTLATNTMVTIVEKVNFDWVVVKIDDTGREGMVLASHLEQAD